jgi:hypothetical protein
MVNTRHGIVEDFMTWTFKLLIHSQILVFLACFLLLGLDSLFFIFVEMFQEYKKIKENFQVYLEGILYL